MDRGRVPKNSSPSKELPRFFPHDSIRPVQSDFLEDLEEVARQGKHLVAMAPTGLGKTASALTAFLEEAFQKGGRVFFLTSKQSQHRIAIETLQRIRAKSGIPLVVADLIARKDMCPRPESRELGPRAFEDFCRREREKSRCTYWTHPREGALARLKTEILHVESHVRLCSEMGVCPHETGIELARMAHVVVCDYNYFFSDLRERIFDRLRVDPGRVFLIVDEAHNLPDRIRENLTREISGYVLETACEELSEIGEGYLSRALGALLQALQSLSGSFDPPLEFREILVKKGTFEVEVQRKLSKFRSIEGNPLDLPTLLSSLQRCAEFYESKKRSEPEGIREVLRFFEVWEEEGEDIVRILRWDPEPILQVVRLDTSSFSSTIFRGVQASVLMSGTLHPPMIRDLLGLEGERTVERIYPSPFPPQNRLLLVDPSVSTSFRVRDSTMWERIAQRILGISQRVPGNVAAFFPSYAILESVLRSLGEGGGRTLLVEEKGLGKKERSELALRLSGGSDHILLGVQGGSLSEGFDFEGNVLKGVLVVGVPYAPPTEMVKALRSCYERKFGKVRGSIYSYDYPAVCRVLQAAGRLIRSEKDRGVVVLMDSRFLLPTISSLFPPTFRPKVVLDIPREIEKFFSKGPSREEGTKGGPLPA